MHFRSSETSPAREFHTLFPGVLAANNSFFFTLKPGQIRVAEYLGSDLCPLLLDLHFDEWALHRNVHRFQTSAFPGEQAPGAARDLVGQIERIRIQIYAVSSMCQCDFTEGHPEAARHTN